MLNKPGANGDSFRPMISADGRYVLFFSWARNLVAGNPPPAAQENLFLRDVGAGVTYALTKNGSGPASFTPDFSRIGCVTQGSTASTAVFQVWDLSTRSVILTNAASPGAASALSQHGDWYSVWSSNHSVLTAYSMDGATNIIVYSGSVSSPAGRILKFTPDARRLIFTTWSNVISRGLAYPRTQLFLYDFPSATLRLVTHAHTNAIAAADGNTVDASISADGRFVVFISGAPNLAPDDTNNLADLFLYDTENGTNTRVGPATGDFAANAPGALALAANRPLLLCEGRRDALLGDDFNNQTDLFATLLPIGAIALEISREPSGAIVLTWPASAGQAYRVEYKESLSDPAWMLLSQQVLIFSSRATVMDYPAAAQRYYRVIVD